MTSAFYGLLVIDKPAGMTSRHVVNRAQGWFPRRTRLGHAGTLDPLATGLLVLGVGQATRLTEYVQRMDKEYQAGLVLGASSDTDDVEGTITSGDVSTAPDRDKVLAELARFVGTIDQIPPDYSAAKVTGRRAYKLARQGKAVELKPRPVRIDAIDVLDYEYPRLALQVRCGKGTYIRSLARDLGKRLGCGAYLERLRRTRIGPFTVEAALPLDIAPEQARERLLGLEWTVAEMPKINLSAPEIARLKQGQTVYCSLDVKDIMPEEVAVFDEEGKLAAIGRWDAAKEAVKPVKVLI